MLYHNQDGTHITKEELEEKLKKIFKENDEWIIDGNYQRTLEMRMRECDTIFLLDYPIEVCLAGAESRVGKKRDDLPWVEEKLDDEFKKGILNFSKEKLPQIYDLIEKYKDNKKVIIFKSREEAESYICENQIKIWRILLKDNNLIYKTKKIRKEKRIMDVEIKTQAKEFHGRSCGIIKQGNKLY